MGDPTEAHTHFIFWFEWFHSEMLDICAALSFNICSFETVFCDFHINQSFSFGRLSLDSTTNLLAHINLFSGAV